MEKILIIEDEQILRENIATFLNMEGYEAVVAENGEKGLELVHSAKPDLIICDIAMPVKDGYAVYSALQESMETEMIPFIFTTAKTQKWEIRKGMELGVDDYLTKPFSFDELLNAVKTRIEKQNKIIKNTEENYQLLIENSLIGIFILQDGNVVFANTKFLELTGYRLNEILGKNLCDLMNKNQNKLDIDINSSMNFKKKISKEFIINNKKGKKVFVEIYGGPIRFKNKLSFFGTLLDITERKILDKTINDTMILAEAEERKRFAADLHDGLGPLLFSMMLHIDLIKKKTEGMNDMKEITKNLDELISTAIKSSKEIANNLTPSILEDFGLSTAINKRIEHISSLQEFKINYKTTIGNVRLDKIIEITFYRIICELLNNTMKHANAKNVKIDLNIENKQLLLKYADDGKGFAGNIGNVTNMGLKNIEGRIKAINGHSEIHSSPGKGVQVSISAEIDT
jgi:PAS domain S-box-containing protein